MRPRRLPHFKYNLNAGPETIEALSENPKSGNCRLAIQQYFFVSSGIRFNPEEILCPRSFRETGTEILGQTDHWDWSQLSRGDVLFAERILGKDGSKVDRSRSSFSTEDLWITYLHSAVFLGMADEDLLKLLPSSDYPKNMPLIWHATAVSGETCVWSTSQFEKYYKPISARRFANT